MNPDIQNNDGNNNIIEEDTQYGKYLTFFLEKESYGIDIKFITEIIGIQPITSVPQVPSFVKGIINLRGKIIPVMDVRVKFGKYSTEYTERTCIIVVELNEVSVGLIVDKVADVVSIPDDNIVSPPDSKTGFENKYIKGIGKIGSDVNLLLDCACLIGEDELVASITI